MTSMKTIKVVLVAITKHGAQQAAALAQQLPDATVCVAEKFAPILTAAGVTNSVRTYSGAFRDEIAPLSADFDQIVFFVSLGAVVRLIAPYLKNKDEDPGVLVVDDALTVRNTLQQLVEDAGFRVQTARDGLEAIHAMHTFKPQVVLTDLEMPNMNGVELTMSLRGRDETRNLPIIMVTSRSQDKHRELAERAGVNFYITKPYNEAELLQAIRKVTSG